MNSKHLHCTSCGKDFPLKALYKCPNCGGILDISYNLDFIKKNSKEQLAKQSATDIWFYRDLLPIENKDSIVTLGEGGTKCISSRILGRKLGINNIYIKNETTNPTGSFKDRPISVGISKAKELSFSSVAISSCGNAGTATAAYAARAGMQAVILVPEKMSKEKLAQMIVCNSTVIKVKGSISDCFKLAKVISEEMESMNLATTFMNPYTMEGDKTVAYELFHELGNQVPKWILIPISVGPLLVGIFKGFRELRELGLISELPSMVGVQVEGCAPIVKAFRNNEASVKPWVNAQTLASGISDPLYGYNHEADRTLKTIRESKGYAVAVPEGDILTGVQFLAETTGIFAEPAGAVSIPAVKTLIEEGIIKNSDQVVCVITGSGFKETDAITKINALKKVREVKPQVDKIKQILEIS